MTFDEVFEENPNISRTAALREVRKHNIEESEFLAEMGDKSYYSSRSVLEWLGY